MMPRIFIAMVSSHCGENYNSIEVKYYVLERFDGGVPKSGAEPPTR